MSFLPQACRCAVALLVFFTGAFTLRAHDAYEISAETRIRADHIEFVITLARSTASYASGKSEDERRRFAAEEFEKVKARLQASAPEFFVFRAGEETLPARTVAVALTVEKDVEMRLTFARPPGGKLRVKAQVFAMLPQESYGSTFFIYGPNGELLANKFINGDDPFVEATLPPLPSPAFAGAAGHGDAASTTSPVFAPLSASRN